MTNHENNFDFARSPRGSDGLGDRDYRDSKVKGFKIINELNEGKFFGEIGLLSNLRRTCSIYSINQCFCAVIPKQDFSFLLDNNPSLK